LHLHLNNTVVYIPHSAFFSNLLPGDFLDSFHFQLELLDNNGLYLFRSTQQYFFTSYRPLKKSYWIVLVVYLLFITFTIHLAYYSLLFIFLFIYYFNVIAIYLDLFVSVSSAQNVVTLKPNSHENQ